MAGECEREQCGKFVNCIFEYMNSVFKYVNSVLECVNSTMEFDQEDRRVCAVICNC